MSPRNPSVVSLECSIENTLDNQVKLDSLDGRVLAKVVVLLGTDKLTTRQKLKCIHSVIYTYLGDDSDDNRKSEDEI